MKVLKFVSQVILVLVLVSLIVTTIQVTTYTSPAIYRVLAYVIVFSLYTRLLKEPFSWISVIYVIATFLYIRIIDTGMSGVIWIQLGSIILGAFLGFFWRRKRYVILSILSIFSIIFIGYLGKVYFAKLELEEIPTLSIKLLNDNQKYLTNHQGQQPYLNKDTVYLVNFSFHSCKPCHTKKKFLAELKQKLANKPFRIIEIHSFESKEIFDKYYLLNDPYVYHDSLDRLAGLYKINGGPEEIIFSKKGYAVRQLGGFSPDIYETYLPATLEFIEKLVRK